MAAVRLRYASPPAARGPEGADHLTFHPDPSHGAGHAPAVAERLAAICRAAGVPEGAVATIHTDHARTAALIADPRVAMVSFTGGRAGGSAVARAAAGKPTALEMGGVASTIVLADADLDLAAPRIVSGMVAAAGQNCLRTFQ